MATVESNSKRLAKNTAFMYIRMAVLMCISLYTSRIVLRELGVEDFGIYNLVGSIVAMFASVRTLFSASTQRYLNYEMGKNHGKNLSDIFNTSIYLNIFISLVFIVGVESLGLWFLNSEINIDSSRLHAAFIVFQLSLFSAVIGIFTTSYDAVIIAHEKMDFYAYLSILEGSGRLGIVFFLQAFVYDKLIVYAVLTTLISMLVLLANYLYCRKYFVESRFTGHLNKLFLKEMMGFAGWNFFGVTAYTLTQNGLNMVLNIFGGPIVNAARGLAYQVTGILNNFMNNITIVINPFGTKLYASGEIKAFFDIIYFSSKTLFLLQSCIVIGVMLFIHELLALWLEQIPANTELFLKLVLINSIVRSLHSPLDLIFKASGNLKYYQLFEGIVLFMPLLVSFFMLKKGYPCSIVFVLIIIFEIINLIIMLKLASKISSFSIKCFYLRVVLPCLIIFIIGFLPIFIINSLTIWLKLFCFIISVLLMVSIYCLFLTKNEKMKITTMKKR